MMTQEIRPSIANARKASNLAYANVFVKIVYYLSADEGD